MTTLSHIKPVATAGAEDRTLLRELRSPGFFAKLPMVGVVMFLLGSLIFGAFAYSVKTNGPLLQWDESTAQALNVKQLNIPSSLVEYVVFGFFLGREVILLICVALAIYFFHKRFLRELMMVLWGPGVGGLLWFVLSRFFDRPRPPAQLDILMLKIPSFPSGHAASAVLGFGLLAYLLIPKMPSRFWKWFVGILAVLIIAFVGLSRILVGGHYLSDVIGGYALGIAWAGVAYTLAERFVPRERRGSIPGQESLAVAEQNHGLRSPGWFKHFPLLGLGLVLFGSLSFAALGYNLMTNGPLVQMDQSLYESLITAARSASSYVNEIMLFGFFLGKQIILILVTLLCIYFVYKHYWMELAMILLSSAAGSFVWDYFVTYFARPRPAIQTGLEVRTIPSFPSGHAMSAMICYGFLAYLLIPKMPSRVWKWVVAIVALLLILFDGYSRIFQGSHYLTDVLAGYALGIAWAALVYTLIETIFMRRKVHNVQEK